MTPSHQTEKPFEFVQTSLFGEPEIVQVKPKRKKRQGAERIDPPPASPPPSPPSVVSRWARAKRRTVGAGIAVWRSARWAQKHKSDIKTAWWVAGLVAAAIAMGVSWWGFTHWQGEIFGYRVKVNKKLPAPDTGWDGQLREEPKPPTKRKPPEVPK